MEGGQVFLVVPRSVGGQRRFRHRNGFHGLLVVERLLLAVGIPTTAADRPKDLLWHDLLWHGLPTLLWHGLPTLLWHGLPTLPRRAGFLVKKGEGRLRDLE